MFAGLLILLAIIIDLLSFQPGTWLSGWDTLHPEFNFPLAFTRLFFGVFRAEQGLGAVAAHSHMADLPRVVFLALSSLILPVAALRYFFISLCLVVGVLGTYIFIKKAVLKDRQLSRVFAFFGGLFYMLNLGTLQQFYVPFEMFTVQYAALPWLFFFAAEYLGHPPGAGRPPFDYTQGKQGPLRWFAVVTLLATPMAFASALWFAYFLALISFLGFYVKRCFGQVIRLVALTLLINSFWLLPAGYFVLSGNAAFVPVAKANKIFSQEAFSYNKSFGTIPDVLILRNFLLDWLVFDYQKVNFTNLMDNWRIHLARPEVLLAGYALSAVAVAGMVYAVWSRERLSLSLALPTVLAVIFLINQNPPVDWLFSLLRDKVPLFGEAMRFPFTKFSIILVFTMSCFFALGQRWIYLLASRLLSSVIPARFAGEARRAETGIYILKSEIRSTRLETIPNYQNTDDLNRFENLVIRILNLFRISIFDIRIYIYGSRIKREMLQSVILITTQLAVFSLLFFLYMEPAFQGDFISKKIQVKIPPEYFAVFDWFSSQPDGRVAAFPINSFWGWIYYQWGFQGAQFISFGIKQPLMDRDYDRWNSGNEEYYREISFAVYSRNVTALEGVLKKFHISYLMLDKNVIAPGQDQKSLFNDEIESLFASSSKITKAKEFGNISIYRFTPENGQMVSAAKAFINVQSEPGPRDLDQIYLKYGDYLVGKQDVSVLATPFSQLIDNQNILNLNKLPVSMFPFDSYFQSKLPLPVILYTKRNQAGLVIKLVPRIVQTSSQSEAGGLLYQLAVSSADDLVFNADNYQSFLLPKTAGDGFVESGTIFLNTETLNNLALYPKKRENDQQDWQMAAFVNRSQGVPASPAGGQGRPLCSLFDSSAVTAELLNDHSVSLIAEKTQGCISLPFNQVVDANRLENYKSVAEFKLNISSATSSLGHYCLFDSGLGRCIKEQEFLQPGQIKDFVLIDPVSVNRLQLVLFVDASREAEEISYTDITFNINNPVGLLTIAPADLRSAVTDYQDSRIPAGMLFSDGFNLVEYDKKPRFCDQVLGDQSRLNFLNQGFIEYNSEQGSSCNYFAFPQLPHNLGFVIRLDNENVAGLPLRMCVANTLSKRCELFTTLSESKSFTTQFFLLPPISDGGVGYNIHFNTYSIGKITAVNRIKDLKIMPFPYAWLNQIGIEGGDVLLQPSVIKIKSVKQIFPGAWVVDYSAYGKGLLVLDQSYDKGFWGSQGEHVKVSGWANGWLVKGEGDQALLIFYWPHLLEIVGFGLMLAGFLVVIPLLHVSFPRKWESI